jgi:hypothetical protein
MTLFNFNNFFAASSCIPMPSFISKAAQTPLFCRTIASILQIDTHILYRLLNVLFIFVIHLTTPCGIPKHTKKATLWTHLLNVNNPLQTAGATRIDAMHCVSTRRISPELRSNSTPSELINGIALPRTALRWFGVIHI